MSAPKKITAKQIEKLTVAYEGWLNTARDLLGRMADEPSACALDACLLLMHGDLHRLHDAAAEREKGTADPVAANEGEKNG